MSLHTLRILVLFSSASGCGATSLELSLDASPELLDGGHANDASTTQDAGDGDADSAGDGSSGLATCTEQTQRPFLKGCVVSTELVNLTPQGHGLPVWQLVMEGTVTELGRGEPPGGCRRQALLGAYSPAPPDPTEDGAWLRLVSDSGEEALVALAVQGAAWRVELGERLSVDFRSKEADFSPNINHLTMRDADGALRAWASSGGDLNDLVLPTELRVQQGEVACTGGGPDQCIESYALYMLSVSADGQERPLPYGAVGRVGSYDVLHGGLEVQTGRSNCADAFVAYAALAAFRP